MKKFLFIVIVSLLAGIYSPSIVKSLTTDSIIKVKDGQNCLDVQGADVRLSLRNLFVFGRQTNPLGEVYINEAFNIMFNTFNCYNCYDVSFDYTINKWGYKPLEGTQTFHLGETATFTLTPEHVNSEDYGGDYEPPPVVDEPVILRRPLR